MVEMPPELQQLFDGWVNLTPKQKAAVLPEPAAQGGRVGLQAPVDGKINGALRAEPRPGRETERI